MFKNLLIFIAISTIACTASAQVNIIPMPSEVVLKGAGSFTISQQTKIIAPGGLQNSASFLNGYLKQYYGFELSTASNASNKNVISLSVKKGSTDTPGGYTLDINSNGIHVQGTDEAGAFYGIQSVLQLLPLEKKSTLAIPYINIKDAPRFVYRGMNLDATRHFMPISFIKKYIDYIALHKMNYFHWHLTDDQGWRVEIKKYPKLTSVGAYRDGTIIGKYPGKANDNIRHGGYYTQEEIKDLVAYAARRYITVIP